MLFVREIAYDCILCLYDVRVLLKSRFITDDFRKHEAESTASLNI